MYALRCQCAPFSGPAKGSRRSAAQVTRQSLHSVSSSQFGGVAQLRHVLVRAEPQQPDNRTTSTSEKDEEEPVWARAEKQRALQAQQANQGFKLPWPLALISSVLVAIAATGCLFEYADRNPFFGIIQPDNPLWAPILLGLGITGYPTSGFLFKYGVDAFNEAAEAQDRMDGYLPKDRK